jgi:hypothetical protein
MYKWPSKCPDEDPSHSGTVSISEDEDDTVARLEAQRREQQQKGMY